MQDLQYRASPKQSRQRNIGLDCWHPGHVEHLLDCPRPSSVRQASRYSSRYCFQVSNGASLRYRLDIIGFNAVMAFSYRILVSFSLCVHRDVGRVVNIRRSAVQTIHRNWLVTVKPIFIWLALLFHRGTTRCRCCEDLAYMLGGIT